MRTAELIAFRESINSHDATQAYNILTGDMPEFCTKPEIESCQHVIRYFNYKITAVLLPAIQELQAAQVDAFKAGIKTASLSAPYNPGQPVPAKKAVKP